MDFTKMEYTEIAKQVIDFQKMSFSNWYNAASMVQDQTTSAMDLALGQSALMPEDGRKAVQSFLDACRQERNRFKAYVDESFANIDKYITKSPKAIPARAE